MRASNSGNQRRASDMWQGGMACKGTGYAAIGLLSSAGRTGRAGQGVGSVGGEGGVARASASLSIALSLNGGGFNAASASRPLIAAASRLSRASSGAAWQPRSPAARAALAEREGFEPPVPLRALLFSRQTRSTTLAPLRDNTPTYREK